MAKEQKKAAVQQGIGWRRWLLVVAVAAACVSTAMGARQVARYVSTDPLFTLSANRPGAVQYHGLTYASRARVQRVFAADFGRSVYSIPLGERRRRLLAIDWVAEASVSRVWPDRLVVRIRERKPVAFVNARSGVLLIDREGVLLDPPPSAPFSFPVINGVDEQQTDAQRALRVRVVLDLLRELGGNARDISEVNAADPENLRVIAQAGGRAVELILGDTNFGARYQAFTSHYPEMRKRSPEAKTFDLRLGDRIPAKD